MKEAVEMRFCTVVNCMDGRVQLPVIRYLQGRFAVDHVDSVTEPGPNRVLAIRSQEELVRSILRRIDISVEKHSSVALALAAHHDCAGNPASYQDQKDHLVAGVGFLRRRYQTIPVIGLWVDDKWEVHEITDSYQGAEPGGKPERRRKQQVKNTSSPKND